MIGATLDHFKLTAELGAGGMGTVYRAEDGKLGREVAIKVLPEAFTRDPERLARFEREATLLAALDHPNIAGIYAVGQAVPTRLDAARGPAEAPVHYLAMQLAPGETLEERIARGPIPLAEALAIAGQIADALEAAHERGIVHRDLKPANVKLAADGVVKVLDFGLAKLALDPATGSGGPPLLSQSPTLTAGMTQAGMLLGTAAYMSPEQARGQEADRRADIWAFGVVLLEMLTGQCSFAGPTVTDTLAAVVRAEPAWEQLPDPTPPALRRLLARCLAKDPRERLRDIGDARLELRAAREEPARTAPPEVAGTSPARLPWALAAATALLAALALWAPWRGSGRAGEPVARLSVQVAPTHRLTDRKGALALSPDGRRLAWASSQDGTSHIYLRPLDSSEARLVPGSEGGSAPFFSANARWLGFVAAGKLKRVLLAGGAPAVVVNVADFLGADWAPDGSLLYVDGWGSGLKRLAPGNPVAEVLTEPRAEDVEGAHLWPQVVQGGETVLFTIWTPTGIEASRVAALDLATGSWKTLLTGALFGRYALGHLLFVRGTTLMAAPFDLDRGEITGEALPIAGDVRVNLMNLKAEFSVADDGSLAYLDGGLLEADRELVWVSPTGEVEAALAHRAAFANPRVSPGGSRIAVTVQGSVFQVWIYDLLRGTRSRLAGAADSGNPVWAPDERMVAFFSNPESAYGVFGQAIDGSGPEVRLGEGLSFSEPTSFSPDGRFLLSTETRSTDGTSGVWLLDLEGGAQRPVFDSSANEGGARFSPDGRFIAYTSDTSGQEEVYVGAFPGPGARWQLTSGGGTLPVWSRDGRDLYFMRGSELFVVAVRSGDALATGEPRRLFDARDLDIVPELQFDAGEDGRLLMVADSTGAAEAPRHVRMIRNWLGALAELSRE